MRESRGHEASRSYAAFPEAAFEGASGIAPIHDEAEASGSASEDGALIGKAEGMPSNGAKKGRRFRRPLTEEEKAERRRAERELVKRSVEQLRSSEGWQAWLRSRSHFHRYSLSNQLLIAIQHPVATRVASLRKWRQAGYKVTKGEHGIRIWAPCPPSDAAIQRWKDAGADPSEEPRTFFKLVAVFAQDQVEALPPPAEPVPLEPPVVDVEGEDIAGLFEPLSTLAQEIGFSVELEQDVPRGAKGYCSPSERKIGISAEMSGNGRVKTLVHEVAHALVREDHRDDDPKMSYAQEELVVESVAMSVCGGLGLDTAGYSIPYLTSWSEGTDIEFLEQVAGLTNRLANRIEASIEIE
jgi:antirestriction protein ArdC